MISSGENGTCNGTGQNGTPSGASVPAGRGRIIVPAPDSTNNPDELSELAREVAAAFGSMVNFYRKHYKLSAEEAVARVDENAPEFIDRILSAPPDQVSWLDLDSLAQKDEAKALERWEQIKQAACNEIRSGYRAARAIEDSGGPWERACFLAARAELMDSWKPRSSVQQQLVDQLAQWQVLLWRWQDALSAWTTCATYGPRRAKKGESYETMRLSEAEALERAMEKVERLHRLYLRTLKALQDQRRPQFPIAVRHAEQVNVGPVQISVENLNVPFHSCENATSSTITSG